MHRRHTCRWSFWFAAFLFAAALDAPPAAAQLPLPPSGEGVRAALVTFGPGDAIFNYFGHNALLIEDRRTGYAVLYNFGMFHFGPEMLPKYMGGRLEFWAGATDLERTFADYVAMNRSIRVDWLTLPADKRLQLARALVEAVQPENRVYLYHHYTNNCSTRVRDLIDRAVDGQLRRGTAMPAVLSLRDHTRRAIQRDLWLDLLLMYWMNGELDRPIRVWDEAFLPDQLQQQVLGLEVQDAAGRHPLVQRSQVVYQATGRLPLPKRPYRLWPWALAMGAFLAAAAVGLAWLRRRAFAGFCVVVGLVFGVPAVCLAGMAAFTDHSFAYWNLNLLLANPLTLLYVPVGIALWRGKAWPRQSLLWIAGTLAVTTLVVAAIALLPRPPQRVHEPLALLGPFNLGMAIAAWRLRHKS